MKEKGRFEQRLFLRTKEQWFPNFIEITYTGIGKTHEGFVLFRIWGGALGGGLARHSTPPRAQTLLLLQT